MVNISSFFSNFFALFILLLHLGCFNLCSHPRFKKKLNPPKKTLFSYIKNLVSSSPKRIPQQPIPSIPSPSSSTRSMRTYQPFNVPINPAPHDVISNHARTDVDDHIYPCGVCGEIFRTPTLLQHHQSVKHAVSDLVDGENIVRIIFKTGWPTKAKNPTIHRILKIHNSPKTVSRFEEYRETVKSKASTKINTLRGLKDERCIADGNELLRFYCTTFICDLDSTICHHQYCSACGIIKSGFSPKMDGISTLPTSWRAHVAIPEDLEEEFGFMHVKRALLVCRVIAGRVGCDPGIVDKEDPGFDSLVGQDNGGFDQDELLVFNPRAVLPCFVIVYTV